MSKIQGTFDEDTLLLYPENDPKKYPTFSQDYYQTPVIRGVATRLQRWPTDLFLAFLAACLIIGSLMLLIFVTVALCLPSIVQNRCRTVEGLELPSSPNVYFLKLENRTWSTREFCYIETAARRHTDLNIYMINLLNNEPTGKLVNNPSDDLLKVESRIPRSVVPNTNDSSKLTPEDQLVARLVSHTVNVHNVDISIDKLFKSTKLSKVARNLNGKMLEMAARAQLLWAAPGIVLSPSMYCNVKTLEAIVCNGTVRDCCPDKLTTIGLENDIQATGVPCQAFMGFLMREILKHSRDDHYTLKTAIGRYCPRLYLCPEIRILKTNSECPPYDLDCPVIYSSTVVEQDRNLLAAAT